MTRVMYLDCFSGAAGDMLLGAFLDAGLPEAALRHALGSLGVEHELHVRKVIRCGVTATKFDVIERAATDANPVPAAPATHSHVHQDDAGGGHTHSHTHSHDHSHEHGAGHSHHHDGHEHTQGTPHDHADGGGHQHGHHHHHGSDGHRSLAEISHLIGHSNLSSEAKARAVALFRRLAEAEAAIHGMSVEEVHLHEVGAVDSIIDIVGGVFAMEWFGVEKVVASPLNVGSGTVNIAHGVFPVPAPATLRLLAGVPVYSAGPTAELVTPTGALLVSGYAQSYGPLPAMTVHQIGYGAGTRDFPGTPNVVRVVIGTVEGKTASEAAQDDVVRIECEIDDMNPQFYESVTGHLFAFGALDVFLTAVQMKKGRPGTLVTVLAPESRRPAVVSVLFRETTTIGVRWGRVEREVLERRWEDVRIGGGVVRIKLGLRGGKLMNASPEFGDCLRIAEATGEPVKAVYADAQRAWLSREGPVKAPDGGGQ